MFCELINLNLEDMPELFKQSRIYKVGNFKHPVFAVFSNSCHFDLTMRSYNELSWTLDTLRYWQFDKTPENVYRNVVGRENTIRQIFNDKCQDLFLRYPNYTPLLEIGILACGDTKEEKVAMAKHHGLSNLLKFLETL